MKFILLSFAATVGGSSTECAVQPWIDVFKGLKMEATASPLDALKSSPNNLCSETFFKITYVLKQNEPHMLPSDSVLTYANHLKSTAELKMQFRHTQPPTILVVALLDSSKQQSREKLPTNTLTLSSGTDFNSGFHEQFVISAIRFSLRATIESDQAQKQFWAHFKDESGTWKRFPSGVAVTSNKIIDSETRFLIYVDDKEKTSLRVPFAVTTEALRAAVTEARKTYKTDSTFSRYLQYRSDGSELPEGVPEALRDRALGDLDHIDTVIQEASNIEPLTAAQVFQLTRKMGNLKDRLEKYGVPVDIKTTETKTAAGTLTSTLTTFSGTLALMKEALEARYRLPKEVQKSAPMTFFNMDGTCWIQSAVQVVFALPGISKLISDLPTTDKLAKDGCDSEDTGEACSLNPFKTALQNLEALSKTAVPVGFVTELYHALPEYKFCEGGVPIRALKDILEKLKPRGVVFNDNAIEEIAEQADFDLMTPPQTHVLKFAKSQTIRSLPKDKTALDFFLDRKSPLNWGKLELIATMQNTEDHAWSTVKSGGSWFYLDNQDIKLIPHDKMVCNAGTEGKGECLVDKFTQVLVYDFPVDTAASASMDDPIAPHAGAAAAAARAEAEAAAAGAAANHQAMLVAAAKAEEEAKRNAALREEMARAEAEKVAASAASHLAKAIERERGAAERHSSEESRRSGAASSNARTTQKVGRSQFGLDSEEGRLREQDSRRYRSKLQDATDREISEIADALGLEPGEEVLKSIERIFGADRELVALILGSSH